MSALQPPHFFRRSPFRRRRLIAARPRRGWLTSPRWLILALAGSTALFLAAISRHPSAPPPPDLPERPTTPVPLALLKPAVATARIGDYLQVQVPGGPDDEYATVFSPPQRDSPILVQTSGIFGPPIFRADRTGTELVTVLLEPKCPAEGICHAYRTNLGAVQITVR